MPTGPCYIYQGFGICSILTKLQSHDHVLMISYFIYVDDCNVDQAQKQRGAANGVATSAMSLFKAFGPAWAGMV
jgi:hypothetical protein